MTMTAGDSTPRVTLSHHKSYVRERAREREEGAAVHLLKKTNRTGWRMRDEEGLSKDEGCLLLCDGQETSEQIQMNHIHPHQLVSDHRDWGWGGGHSNVSSHQHLVPYWGQITNKYYSNQHE